MARAIDDLDVILVLMRGGRIVEIHPVCRKCRIVVQVSNDGPVPYSSIGHITNSHFEKIFRNKKG